MKNLLLFGKGLGKRFWMTKSSFPILLFSVLFSGCSLIPKDVEYFQKKVRSVPTMSHESEETLRQTALLAKTKASQVANAARDAKASPEILEPAEDVVDLTDAVSVRVGSPLHPWSGTTQAICQKMSQQNAQFQLKLSEYKERVNEFAGKKIEGTGLIQIPYLLNLLLWGVLGLGAFSILKAFLATLFSATPTLLSALLSTKQTVKHTVCGVKTFAKIMRRKRR